MTTIACWFNKESAHTSVWVCGDSRVSNIAATAILIDSSPKIFTVPVRCFEPGEKGFFDAPVFNGTIGVAYAGNSLVGLTLNSALASCLASLISVSGPPRLDDIAAYARGLLQKYVVELGFTAGKNALCELAIVGFCPVELRHKIYHLSPTIEEKLIKYELSVFDDTQDDGFVLLLGNDSKRIGRTIESSRAGIIKNILWWRRPKSVIWNEVHSPMNSSIGGHLQLGIGGAHGFQLFSTAQPNDGGDFYLSYLGLNLTAEEGLIGHCQIAMPGMI